MGQTEGSLPREVTFPQIRSKASFYRALWPGSSTVRSSLDRQAVTSSKDTKPGGGRKREGTLPARFGSRTSGCPQDPSLQGPGLSLLPGGASPTSLPRAGESAWPTAGRRAPLAQHARRDSLARSSPASRRLPTPSAAFILPARDGGSPPRGPHGGEAPGNGWMDSPEAPDSPLPGDVTTRVSLPGGSQLPQLRPSEYLPPLHKSPSSSSPSLPFFKLR
ncbi:uncharacterized protein LOC133379073 [Rhineura floridana]|uniref:uncharacterized protein LOC133379073 n=1 Tax=Rhineura floridana TaxID=261503 RepID=UPI002AC7F84C|nr:uncharacterized protein LOC133379073 [Rhineura floridana]